MGNVTKRNVWTHLGNCFNGLSDHHNVQSNIIKSETKKNKSSHNSKLKRRSVIAGYIQLRAIASREQEFFISSLHLQVFIFTEQSYIISRFKMSIVSS